MRGGSGLLQAEVIFENEAKRSGGVNTPPDFSVLTLAARWGYNKEAKAEYRGVAHLVERLVWDQEARSSSLRTSTNQKATCFLRWTRNRLLSLKRLCLDRISLQCFVAKKGIYDVY